MREEGVAIDERPFVDLAQVPTRLEVGELRDVALALLVVVLLQLRFLGRVLLEDALGDDLVDLVRDQVRLELEAGIESAHERGLEVGAVDDLLEIQLAGGDDPDLALALVADHLGQRVQLADLVVGVADEGPHLVDHEDEVLDLASGGLLGIRPLDELVGDAFRGDLLVAEHVSQRVVRCLRVGVLGRIDLG